MSFFGRMKSALFGGSVESPFNMMGGLFQTGQPPRRGSKEMLEAYKRLPWLHAVVRKISTDIAATEWRLYKPIARTQVKARKVRRWKSGAVTSSEDNLTDVEAHPLLDVLAKPNPILGPIGVFFLLQAYLEVKGEAPVIIERGTDGLPFELWPTPPNWLQAGPSASEATWRFNYSGFYAVIPQNGVMLLREPDLVNPYGRGIGTGDALADELDIDEFAAQHIKAWFYNRALPDAFISMEGLTDAKQAKKWEEELRSKHQGTGKGGQIHIANGKVTVEQLSQTFKEQQLAETRGQQRDTILQTYGVPPECMGIIENSNRATIDAADYLYAKGVLVPRLNGIAGYLTTLAQEWDENLVVGYESPVPEDREFALKVMIAVPEVFTKNEFRCIAGEEPREEFGDELMEKAAPPQFGAPPGAPQLPPGEQKPPPKPGEDPVDPEEEDPEEEKGASVRRLLPGRYARAHSR